MRKSYISSSDPSIEVPPGLDKEYLEQEFGADAVTYYENRIAERKNRGKIYYNPLKTMYLWLSEDREYRCGYYAPFLRNFNRGKMKNHGRS